MKYLGKGRASNGADIYTFTVGKQELEILSKVISLAFLHVPKTIDSMIYRGRLRAIDKELGRVYVEEIRGKRLPTKYTGSFHKRIKKHHD